MKSDYCILVLSMAPIITAYSSSAHAEFEASMLKQLGVSASTLDQLESNKSPAGKYLVDVYLNGNKVTSDWVMVGDDGEVKKDGQFFSLIFPEIESFAVFKGRNFLYESGVKQNHIILAGGYSRGIIQKVL
ncbi:hypothetical protein ACM3CZ_17980 [Edwardsiella ictaluri]